MGRSSQEEGPKARRRMPRWGPSRSPQGLEEILRDSMVRRRRRDLSWRSAATLWGPRWVPGLLGPGAGERSPSWESTY